MWWIVLCLAGVDLDGDGSAEVAIGTLTGEVRILSGRSGEELHGFTIGESRPPCGGFDVALFEGRNRETLVLVLDAARGFARWFSPDGRRVGTLPARQPRATPAERHPLVFALGAPGEAVFVRAGLAMCVGTEHGPGVCVGAVGAIDLAGDLDGDGVREFVVGRPLADEGRGVSEVLSGRSGARLFGLENRVGGRFGTSVANVGDVDGDSVPDLAVGAPHGWVGGRATDVVSDGAVVLFSGATGDALVEWTAESQFDRATRFGASIVPLGDVDGDARPDFAVGAYKHDPRASETQRGSVSVHSGGTGALVFEVFGPEGGVGFFGSRVRSPGDANADGVDDLLVQDSEGWTLLSGRDGSLLWHRDARDTHAAGRPWRIRRIEGRGERSFRLVRGD